MHVPFLAIAIAVLVWLVTGSIIAGVATFVVSQLLLLLFAAILVAAAKSKVNIK
jgi:hypothetical protein